MSGIYGFYSRSEITFKNHYDRFFSSKLASIENQETVFGNFIYGRSVLQKFPDDRFMYEDDKVIISLEGIIYNFDEAGSEIPAGYKKSGIDFVEELEGSFSGFIYDKRQQEIYLFTDILSTKSLYYYSDPVAGRFFFSSELKVLSSLLRDLNISFQPDEDGFNCLLTLGYMLDDITLIKEIKRLDNATIATIDLTSGNVEKKNYFHFSVEEVDISLDDAINRLEVLLTNAVSKEWKKDRTESINALTFISGGLDARVNALLANELGFNNISSLNFSQTGAADHLIAKEISEGEGFSYIFYPLDEGRYFLDSLEELVAANDGMVTISGAAHMYRALQNIPLEPFGMGHSGQIGGVLFGSFNRPEFDLKKDIGKLGYVNDREILSQISILPEIVDRYKHSVERFSYEQRQINGTLNGDRLCSHLIDIQSPFYNKDLILFCLSLPPSFKVGKKLYVEWIREKHPHFFNYKWDSAGITPKNKLLTAFFLNLNRARKLLSRLKGNDRSAMNPFDNWFDSNPSLRTQVENTFQQSMKAFPDGRVKENTLRIFHHYKARGKFNALTCSLAYKLHFKPQD